MVVCFCFPIMTFEHIFEFNELLCLCCDTKHSPKLCTTTWRVCEYLRYAYTVTTLSRALAIDLQKMHGFHQVVCWMNNMHLAFSWKIMNSNSRAFDNWSISIISLWNIFMCIHSLWASTKTAASFCRYEKTAEQIVTEFGIGEFY
jgi:hypothetical protein